MSSSWAILFDRRGSRTRRLQLRSKKKHEAFTATYSLPRRSADRHHNEPHTGTLYHVPFFMPISFIDTSAIYFYFCEINSKVGAIPPFTKNGEQTLQDITNIKTNLNKHFSFYFFYDFLTPQTIRKFASEHAKRGLGRVQI